MIWRVKNWSKHQHFKDRTPPWIKLYRDILDDPDWYELDGNTSKILVSLWLIASEDESRKGFLPDSRRLAFRLRISEAKLNQEITKLSHWLICDDITPISARYQSDAPERAPEETETETETETDSAINGGDGRFEQFWKAYPRKQGKGAAEKAFAKAKLNGHFDSLLTALELQKQSEQWQKDGGQYIPNPATWLNQKRWDDEVPGVSAAAGNSLFAGVL